MTSPTSYRDALVRVTLRMASSRDLAEVLSEITRGLAVDEEAALARIWLVDTSSSPAALRLAASAGLSERLDGSRSRIAVGALKIGQIAETRTPLYTNDLHADARFVDPAWIDANGLVAFAGYPLVYRDELLGVLAMFSRRRLSSDELERLGVFAAQAAIAIKNAELFAHNEALLRRLEAENSYLKEELSDGRALEIVGESPALTHALEQLRRVAQTASTVLLLGETGTGKELFARAVHEMSPRHASSLVKVNCSALTPSLIESELFGHEKGAFTGATQRKIGRFELADGGTLFLDEITELSLDGQTKLLRVLQEREVERVGGTSPIALDIRIVAATNRDIAAEVKAGRFRSDLYFRLNVFPLHVPPLRDRREDIPRLADAFLRKLAVRSGVAARSLDDDARAYLRAYDWPGNVRELENVLERAAVLSRGEVIRVVDLPELASTRDEAPPPGGSQASLKERVAELERALIAEALERASGNQSEAARALRVSRATLQYRMRILGLAAS